MHSWEKIRLWKGLIAVLYPRYCCPTIPRFKVIKKNKSYLDTTNSAST